MKHEQDNIDKLFKRLEADFDHEVPSANHELRFLEKLEASKTAHKTVFYKKPVYRIAMGIAASILLMISVFTITQTTPESRDLASVSPELAQTQNFFTLTINEELKKLNQAKTPETEALIQDALKQMEILETDYESLKTDLIESGDDKRVIYAMISNFQNRIDILKTVLEQIESIKLLKNNSNENSITL